MAVPLKLVFLGSDPIALPLLDWLAGEGRSLVEIAAVYNQPDRPAGAGQKTEPGPVKQWALAHDRPVRQPAKLDEVERAWLAALQPDLALVMAYGHILEDSFIAIPRLGTLNVHASLLPKYRGASPIQSAVANGEFETGVTLMRIVRKLDAGPVADGETVPITSLDTSIEVEAKLAKASVTLVARALPWLRAGALEFSPQDEVRATYCRRLTKEDSVLDFAANAPVLAARINGLFPWPGCTVDVNGTPVKLGLADAEIRFGDLGHNTSVPGTVLGTDDQGLFVVTGRGTLRLRKLQRPGGKMLPTADFLRGFPIRPGTSLPSRPMSLLVAP